MWLMDGRSMKNKRGFIEPVHQTCIQDCTLFSCDLRTLGSGRHHLFKCHYAYISVCLNIPIYSKTVSASTGVNYGC